MEVIRSPLQMEVPVVDMTLFTAESMVVGWEKEDVTGYKSGGTPITNYSLSWDEEMFTDVVLEKEVAGLKGG